MVNSCISCRTDMLVHVVNRSEQVMPIPVVLKRLDQGYATLTNNSQTFSIENVFVSTLLEISQNSLKTLTGKTHVLYCNFNGKY